jgi:branched-chain amino acid transport system ATP-binding protein
LKTNEKTLLEIKDLNVNYGDFRALNEINISVPESFVVSLIGANGAGKSTIMNTVLGINKPVSGTVAFEGENITAISTNKIVARGLTMSPEGSHVYEKMTIRDNLLMGAFLTKSNKKRRQNLERVYSLFPILKEKERQYATLLSGGQRQMLAIGRALMTDPKLLLCDEISLGLAPGTIKDIYTKLREINAEGITLLIVEQDVKRSLVNSDYSYVILEGKVVMEGHSDKLKIEDVNDAYFGIKKYAE